MRSAILVVVLSMYGCLAVSEPHNPVKKRSIAPVRSATAAPLVTSTKASSKSPVSEAPKTLEDARREFLKLSRVDRMKALFDLKQELQNQFLKLAEGLTEDELAELNEWLSERGTRLQRRCDNPNHDHSKSGGGHKDPGQGGGYY